jgi:hypothetical protein
LRQERATPSAGCGPLHRVEQLSAARKASDLRLIDGALELALCGGCGEVDECAGRTRGGDPMAQADVLRIEGAGAMYAQPWARVGTAAADGDVDRSAGVRLQPPQGRGGVVAQDRVGPAGEDCRELSREREQRGVPHRVDPAVQAVESSRRQAMVDRAETESQGRELGSRDDAVSGGPSSPAPRATAAETACCVVGMRPASQQPPAYALLVA